MIAAAPFLRNAWYMAGWSSEVGEDLLGRRILGEPVLLGIDSGATRALRMLQRLIAMEGPKA